MEHPCLLSYVFVGPFPTCYLLHWLLSTCHLSILCGYCRVIDHMIWEKLVLVGYINHIPLVDMSLHHKPYVFTCSFFMCTHFHISRPIYAIQHTCSMWFVFHSSFSCMFTFNIVYMYYLMYSCIMWSSNPSLHSIEFIRSHTTLHLIYTHTPCIPIY